MQEILRFLSAPEPFTAERGSDIVDPGLRDIDARIELELETTGTPGAALVVARNGRVIHARGYGFADAEMRRVADAQTVWPIASITKVLTAVAVMQIVEAGELSLDDPVAAHIDQPPVPDEYDTPITVADLLRHTSGLRARDCADRRLLACRRADHGWTGDGMKTRKAPRSKRAARKPGFSALDLAALDKAKILGVRAGTAHRYTGVWVVVVEDRVFVRSWNDKPTGWYRAFLDEPGGTILLQKREIAVRGRPVRSERLRHAVSRAYAVKYDTKASEKWVRGFAEQSREATTLEFLPS